MRVLSVVPLLLLAACGVPNGKSLGDMDEGDWKSLCTSLESEEKTVTCDIDGTEIDVTTGGSAADCETDYTGGFPESCEATVGDLRDCNDALYEDPCLLFSETAPAGCDAVFSCMLDA